MWGGGESQRGWGGDEELTLPGPREGGKPRREGRLAFLRGFSSGLARVQGSGF